MFMLSMGAGQNLGFPDVCLVPGTPPVPTPFPDIQLTATSAPAVSNVLVDAMPTLNLMSKGVLSQGDEAGSAGGGVASHVIAGQTQYLAGCSTILVGGAPAQRLTSTTGQNCAASLPNTAGACVSPSQTTVLTLG